MTAIRTVLLLGTAVLGFATAAHAADMAIPSYDTAPQMVPVEVGSGWYLRGDVSYDFKTDLDVDYRSFDGTTYGSRAHDSFDLDDAADFGVGFGYQFTDFFRGDLTARYAKADVDGRSHGPADIDCSGASLPGATCDTDEAGKMRTWELMANAYLDLGTFAGFTPYVGGGAGAVHVDYDDLKGLGACSGVVCDTASFEHAGQDDWRFAYALTAGLAYDVTRSLKLDIGYRYLDVDGGKVAGWDADAAALGATGTQITDDGFHRHTIQAGLRYSLF